MLNRTKNHENKEQDNTQHETTREQKPYSLTKHKNNTRTAISERSIALITVGFKVLVLSTSLGPDVILNTELHKKKFSSHNGSLTQSMNYSENTKIKLITMINQRTVLLANPTNIRTMNG